MLRQAQHEAMSLNGFTLTLSLTKSERALTIDFILSLTKDEVDVPKFSPSLCYANAGMISSAKARS